MMQTGVDRAVYSKMVEQRPSMFTNEGRDFKEWATPLWQVVGVLPGIQCLPQEGHHLERLQGPGRTQPWGLRRARQ